MKKIIKKPLFWVIVVIAAFAVLLFVIPRFFPWTPLNCQHEYVDIMTGRVRLTRHLLFYKVSERIEESPLSKALPADMIEATKPEWRRVNTFSPGLNYSPHYIFHGATSQIVNLNTLWSSFNPPLEVKRQMAIHVLALWQHSEGVSTARKYLQWFWDRYAEIRESEDQRKKIFDRLLLITITTQEQTNETTRFTAYYPDGTILDEYNAYLNEKGD